MVETVVVRPGPQEYLCEEGSLDLLPEKLEERELFRVLILHGEKSWQKAQPYLNRLLNSVVEIETIRFNGECSYDEVARVEQFAEAFEADAIIGIGGGKVMDTAKYVANNIHHAQAVLIPTLASNCAPWTPLSVMYTPEGEYIGFDFFTKQVNLLLIEPRLVIDSPVNYFIAGIGDTLAKWYESDAILSLPENTTAPLLMARAAAKSCKEIIEKEAIQAVENARNGQLTSTYTKVVETIILTSGLVGGLGDALARTTGAHGIHDGLTIYPEVHHFLHGEKVAYGVLVQLALDKKFEELPKVYELFKTLDLPTRLADLGLTSSNELHLELAQSTIDHFPNIFNLPYPISPEIVAEAIGEVEAFTANQ